MVNLFEFMNVKKFRSSCKINLFVLQLTIYFLFLSYVLFTVRRKGYKSQWVSSHHIVWMYITALSNKFNAKPDKFRKGRKFNCFGAMVILCLD